MSSHERFDRDPRIHGRHDGPIGARHDERTGIDRVLDGNPALHALGSDGFDDIGNDRVRKPDIRRHLERRRDAARAADVGHLNEAVVRDLVELPAETVRLARGLDRVETCAHGAVARRVHLDREAERVEPSNERIERRGRHHEQPPVTVAALGVRIRLYHRSRVTVRRHAVEQQLDTRRRQTLTRVQVPVIHVVGRVLAAVLASPRHASRDALL